MRYVAAENPRRTPLIEKRAIYAWKLGNKPLIWNFSFLWDGLLAKGDVFRGLL
jgi:hypothetical protein